MELQNNTKISNELIKAVAHDVGLDLRVNAVLEIEYIGEIKGSIQGDNSGEFFAYDYNGVTHYVIRILPWSTTETLAHEMRHVAQCQSLGGFDNMVEINQLEMETMGYWENILEIDARESAKAWRV